MEASLLQLVLDVAFVGFPQVTEHFRKNQFQGICADVLQGASILVFYFLEALPTDIECRSVEMCRVWRSIAVAAAQAFYVVLGAEYGSHNYLVWIQPLGGQLIKEVVSDGVQQAGGARNEIRDGMRQ